MTAVERTLTDAEHELADALQVRDAVTHEAQGIQARLKAADERVLGLRRECAAFRKEEIVGLPELVVRTMIAAGPPHELELQTIADRVLASKQHIAVTIHRNRLRPFTVDGLLWRITAHNPARGVVKVELLTPEEGRAYAARLEMMKARRKRRDDARHKANVARKKKHIEAQLRAKTLKLQKKATATKKAKKKEANKKTKSAR